MVAPFAGDGDNDGEDPAEWSADDDDMDECDASDDDVAERGATVDDSAEQGRLAAGLEERAVRTAVEACTQLESAGWVPSDL